MGSVPSSFAWVDFSEEDRQRMNAVVQLFQESETVDELGLGVVRDVFANLLFPGTSTIQTRARYFFFIPWIYRRQEERRVSVAEIAKRARDDEIKLIDVLLENEDHAGVIGAQKRAALKGLPSAIYWAGLGQYGIRRFVGSQDEYHRSFGSRVGIAERDGDDEENSSGNHSTWDPSLPDPPAEFPRRASLALTREEAEYFVDRVDAIQPRCLLAVLMSRMGASAEVPLPWLHPGVSSLGTTHRAQLEHARNFSETFYGASLLYNLMLGEAQNNEEAAGRHRESLNEWSKEMTARQAAHRVWNRTEFWMIAGTGNVDGRMRAFIDDWLKLVIDGHELAVHESTGARDLIKAREWEIKRNRARLHNQSALERWNGRSGAFQATYRWSRVRQIVGDVRRGLGKTP